VGPVTVTDSSHLTAQISIDSSAAIGARSVRVTTGDEVASLDNGFTVMAGMPIVSSVDPNSGQQGQSNLTVAITGKFTHFSGGTSLVDFGAGITVASPAVFDGTHLSVQISIDSAASGGP